MDDDRADKILIVDDTPANMNILMELLEPRGYVISAAPSGRVALNIASRFAPDLILLDVVMPDMDGFETCRQLKNNEATRDIPVIFISAREETTSLVQGFRAGGVDYIVKPFEPEEVLMRVETRLKLGRLRRQLTAKNQELQARTQELIQTNEQLHREVTRRKETEVALEVAGSQLSLVTDREAQRWGVASFVGKSQTINKILRDIRRLQNFGNINVLITGESGTGKELVARAIHYGSSRIKAPFIAVNCVAIPEELAESMLFGHVRGAFTGATIDRKGYFELANGGSLFLDEIGDMPSSLQAKLLRVLEDGNITPIGSTQTKHVDVRIVAATNANLHVNVPSGSFRQDLYFRLAQFTVEVPPLRHRREDIPLLATHFLEVFATEMGMKAPPLAAEALEALTAHDFPGNIRELKNVIERSLIESGGLEIQSKHLHLVNMPMPVAGGTNQEIGPKSEDFIDLPLNLEQAENILIQRALAQTHGNIAEAARLLGVNRTRIYRKFGSEKLETL